MALGFICFINDAYFTAEVRRRDMEITALKRRLASIEAERGK